MKRQIRRATFETNSSSTHVIQILNSSDYDKWCGSDLYLYEGSGWCYEDNMKPEQNHIYTKEEVIDFLKASKYPPEEDTDWDDEDVVSEIFRDSDFFDSDYYFERNYETFERTFTTPNGDKIVAFGYYGSDY